MPEENHMTGEELRANKAEETMEEFLNSSLYREIMDLLTPSNIKVPEWVLADRFACPCLCLDRSVLTNIVGYACIISVRAMEGCTDLIDITSGELLEKLRSLNGQFTNNGTPVFYYENVMSTADYKVFVETGQMPTLGGPMYSPIKGSAVAASMTFEPGAREAPVQELSDGEIAGRLIMETYNPGSTLSPVEDILSSDSEKKK
jgi:hypothetical protein